MDYFSLIQRIRDGLPIERIQIDGGQVEGHVRMEEPEKKERGGKNIMTGFQYADASKMREKLEELKFDEATSRHKRLDDVDYCTSIGTLPNVNDLDSDDLTQVYNNYSFKSKPNSQLLVHQHREQILENISCHQVTIIKGATGCGKTTQVPQFILDQHREINMHCNIIVTQPRRIAAISVAKRVCEERGWPLGTLVGYQIALDKAASPDTRLLFVTTGVLLQILVKRQNLNDYTHIIVDEVHERDSDADFLLIVLKKFMRNPQCRTKVILMSATLNDRPFTDYFTRTIRGVDIEPPVVLLNRETNYRVSYFYLDSLHNRLPFTIPDLQYSTPSIGEASYDLARALVEVFALIDEHEHNKEFIGSVLIFLPGIAEIEAMYEKLSKNPPLNQEKWWICPLHSTVTYEEQMKVFKAAPQGHRKIILATNIAESSITVSDTKYVIDFCLGKQQILEQETGYASLVLTWISKAQGTQRAGRVGRVMPGRVYRLVPKSLYQEFPDEAEPEIVRCPLDQLVLKAKLLNMGTPEELLGLAINPPDLSNIHKTILKLKQLGALLLTLNGKYEENDGDLTFVGHVMASLPLDPTLSKLIILGHLFSVLPEAIIMACALSMKSIFSTPFQAQMKAYTSKLTWADFSCSDPIAYLNAYALWRHKTSLGLFKRSGGQTEEKWCRQFFIQRNIIREVSRLEQEVTSRLKTVGIENFQGDSKVTWSKEEKPLILKIVIAGAFYPNYFVPSEVDEKEAVKEISGRDPFSTVYLSGMPMNQPGPLYVHSIKKHFADCGSAIDVSFDGSSKVYLQFGSSHIDLDSTVKNALMPGKISLAVYRAIKLRQLQIPITIPMLLPHEAKKRAEEIFGDKLHPTLVCNKEKSSSLRKKEPMLPALSNNILSIVITHVDSPSRFWVNINDEIHQSKVLWIHKSINSSTVQLPPFVGSLTDGNICIAPYIDSESKSPDYYRAKIMHIVEHKDNPKVMVHFIDFGNDEQVYASQLKDFPETLHNIKEEPGLAIQCYLAEVGPSLNNTAKGDWGSEAMRSFARYFPDNTATAKVYSAVNNVMALILFSNSVLQRSKERELLMELSFNYHLIQRGLADPMDEPYLSRENHLVRESFESSPESTVRAFATDLYSQPYQGVKFTPPADSECRTKTTLKGPKSPLETNLFCLTRKCQGKETVIEWNSVNSVLLDTYPMDPHMRLIVAANATHNSSTRLTLRNTTVMPNIHGLAALICLIFSPRIELRSDKARRYLTGALCGLGFDPDTGEPFYPENDLEISFDTKITLLDLENINKIRFWMDHALTSPETPESNVARPAVVKSTNKIKEYILDLIRERRPSLPHSLEAGAPPFLWDQIPSEDLLDPHDSQSVIFPLIWGINLIGDGMRDNAMLAHLVMLEEIAKGIKPMRAATQCQLCQIYLEVARDVRLHLATTLHKMKEADFKRSFHE